jgi:UDP-glucose 4-epimerase
MHFAASAYVGESVIDPQKYYLNNVRNTLTLLEVMLEHKVADLIFSSTCSTYGDPRYLPMTEDHPLEPVNPYGRSKLMVERILRDYAMAYGLRYVSLRYFNAAGADPDGDIGEWHEPETHLIPLALYTALGRRPALQVFGTGYQTPDGTCIRDYVHVSDLAAAHVLAMEHLLRGGASEVFNLGTGGGSSVRQVIDAAQRIAGRPITVIESPPRPGDPPVLVASSAKAMDHLGWRPRYTDIASIVETAWTWHSSRETSVRGR